MCAGSGAPRITEAGSGRWRVASGQKIVGGSLGLGVRLILSASLTPVASRLMPPLGDLRSVGCGVRRPAHNIGLVHRVARIASGNPCAVRHKKPQFERAIPGNIAGTRTAHIAPSCGLCTPHTTRFDSPCQPHACSLMPHASVGRPTVGWVRGRETLAQHWRAAHNLGLV